MSRPTNTLIQNSWLAKSPAHANNIFCQNNSLPIASPIFPVSQEHNFYLNDHEERFKQLFPFHQRIRGDGACYFNSCIAGILNKCVDNIETWNTVRQALINYGYPNIADEIGNEGDSLTRQHVNELLQVRGDNNIVRRLSTSILIPKHQEFIENRQTLIENTTQRIQELNLELQELQRIISDPEDEDIRNIQIQIEERNQQVDQAQLDIEFYSTDSIADIYAESDVLPIVSELCDIPRENIITLSIDLFTLQTLDHEYYLDDEYLSDPEKIYLWNPNGGSHFDLLYSHTNKVSQEANPLIQQVQNNMPAEQTNEEIEQLKEYARQKIQPYLSSTETEFTELLKEIYQNGDLAIDQSILIIELIEEHEKSKENSGKTHDLNDFSSEKQESLRLEDKISIATFARDNALQIIHESNITKENQDDFIQSVQIFLELSNSTEVDVRNRGFLMTAALLGKSNFIEPIFRAGEDFSQKDPLFTNNTALMWAIANANNKFANDLLSFNERNPDVNIAINHISTHYDTTALHLAVAKGYTKKESKNITVENHTLVKKLIALGADPNIRTKHGTPLDIAIARRDIGMIEEICNSKQIQLATIINAQESLKLDYQSATKRIESASRIYQTIDKTSFNQPKIIEQIQNILNNKIEATRGQKKEKLTPAQNFIKKLEERLKTLEKGELFTVELDIDGCFLNGNTSGMYDIENPVNSGLESSLTHIKELVENKGSEFQLNICSTAAIESIGPPETRQKFLTSLVNLNNGEPIIQLTAEGRRGNIRLITDKPEDLKKKCESKIQLKKPNEIDVSDFKRNHELPLADSFNKINLKRTQNTLSKESALDFTLKLKIIAQKLQLQDDHKKKTLTEIQREIITGHITINNDIKIEDTELKKAARNSCFVDNDPRYHNEIQNQKNDKNHLTHILNLCPQSTAVTLKQDATGDYAHLKKENYITVTPSTINNYITSDNKSELIELRQDQLYYGGPRVNQFYYPGIFDHDFPKDSNIGFTYLVDLNKDLGAIKEANKIAEDNTQKITKTIAPLITLLEKINKTNPQEAINEFTEEFNKTKFNKTKDDPYSINKLIEKISDTLQEIEGLNWNSDEDDADKEIKNFFQSDKKLKAEKLLEVLEQLDLTTTNLKTAFELYSHLNKKNTKTYYDKSLESITKKILNTDKPIFHILNADELNIVDADKIVLLNQLIAKNKESINQRDENENTPLHIAAQKGSETCIKFLIKNKANPNLRNKDKKTAYDLAKSNKIKGFIKPINIYEDLIKTLNSKGTNLQTKIDNFKEKFNKDFSKRSEFEVENENFYATKLICEIARILNEADIYDIDNIETKTECTKNTFEDENRIKDSDLESLLNKLDVNSEISHEGKKISTSGQTSATFELYSQIHRKNIQHTTYYPESSKLLKNKIFTLDNALLEIASTKLENLSETEKITLLEEFLGTEKFEDKIKDFKVKDLTEDQKTAIGEKVIKLLTEKKQEYHKKNADIIPKIINAEKGYQTDEEISKQLDKIDLENSEAQKQIPQLLQKLFDTPPKTQSALKLLDKLEKFTLSDSSIINQEMFTNMLQKTYATDIDEDNQKNYTHLVIATLDKLQNAEKISIKPKTDSTTKPYHLLAFAANFNQNLLKEIINKHPETITKTDANLDEETIKKILAALFAENKLDIIINSPSKDVSHLQIDLISQLFQDETLLEKAIKTTKNSELISNILKYSIVATVDDNTKEKNYKKILKESHFDSTSLEELITYIETQKKDLQTKSCGPDEEKKRQNTIDHLEKLEFEILKKIIDFEHPYSAQTNVSLATKIINKITPETLQQTFEHPYKKDISADLLSFTIDAIRTDSKSEQRDNFRQVALFIIGHSSSLEKSNYIEAATSLSNKSIKNCLRQAYSSHSPKLVTAILTKDPTYIDAFNLHDIINDTINNDKTLNCFEAAVTFLDKNNKLDLLYSTNNPEGKARDNILSTIINSSHATKFLNKILALKTIDSDLKMELLNSAIDCIKKDRFLQILDSKNIILSGEEQKKVIESINAKSNDGYADAMKEFTELFDEKYPRNIPNPDPPKGDDDSTKTTTTNTKKLEPTKATINESNWNYKGSNISPLIETFETSIKGTPSTKVDVITVIPFNNIDLHLNANKKQTHNVKNKSGDFRVLINIYNQPNHNQNNDSKTNVKDNISTTFLHILNSISDACNLDKATTLKLINLSKQHEGLGNFLTQHRANAQEEFAKLNITTKQATEFSKLFQKGCEKCGIYTGREDFKSFVGLRLHYIPQEVVKQFENFNDEVKDSIKFIGKTIDKTNIEVTNQQNRRANNEFKRNDVTKMLDTPVSASL